MSYTILGNHPSHGMQSVAHINQTDIQLTWKDSGKFITIDQSATGANMVAYLPKMTTEIAGWHATFVLSTVSNKLWTLRTYNATESSAGDSGIIYWQEYLEGSNLQNAWAVVFRKATTGDDPYNNSASQMRVQCDGTNWYVQCFAGSADGFGRSGA